MKLETRKVPAQALRFDVGRFEFQQANEETTAAPIRMLGRSAEPIEHWYWGKVVHDMEGFTTDHPRVPIDWAHDDTSDEGIGYLDKFEATDEGLYVEGELISVESNDRAHKIIKKAAAGVPYQASIFFRGEQFEEIPPGFTTEVNGRQLEGPAVIVRQWALRGMAVCLYGADHRTESTFSSDASEVSITVSIQEPEMAAKKKEKLTAEVLDSPVVSEEAVIVEEPQAEVETIETVETVEAVETPEEPNKVPAVEASEDVRSQLRQYISQFGAEDGATWFAEGIDFSAAQSRYVAKLQQELKTANERNAELAEKLSSLDRGSDQPLSFSSPDASEPSTRFSHLGSNLSRFANGLKLPSSN